MNIFSRIIFLFIFSTSITHAQVYYEDSVRYSLQNIVTSSLNEVNKFTEEDKNNISELESPNEPQTYNKIGQACQIDFYNSVWKNKKKGNYIYTSFSTIQQCKKNNISNYTQIEGVCPIYERKTRTKYTVKNNEKKVTDISEYEEKPVYLGFFKRDDSTESIPIVQEEKKPINFEHLTALDLTLLCANIELSESRKLLNEAIKKDYDSKPDKNLEKTNN